MKQEDRELLLKDLCARLPYGVKIKIRSNDIRTANSINIYEGVVYFVESDPISPFGLHIEHPTTLRQQVKPCLRPMFSVTEEEKHDLLKLGGVSTLSNGEVVDVACVGFERHAGVQDWLNLHQFDYRGLIEKGLALEAPEGMYNI